MIPVLFALVVVAIILGTVVLGQPDECAITRSLRMSASPEKIFPHVNTLRQWEAWSPWAQLDPNSKSTYSGPESGTNAALRWEGNSKVGMGTMTIIENQAPSLVALRLDFEKPMQATNVTRFTFVPDGPQTNVIWTMTGTSSLMGKIVSTLVNYEKIVGDQFAQGLSNLKAVVETQD